MSAGTSLGQLGLESINLVYFVAEVQQHYDLRDALFNQLRAGLKLGPRHRPTERRELALENPAP